MGAQSKCISNIVGESSRLNGKLLNGRSEVGNLVIECGGEASSSSYSCCHMLLFTCWSNWFQIPSLLM